MPPPSSNAVRVLRADPQHDSARLLCMQVRCVAVMMYGLALIQPHIVLCGIWRASLITYTLCACREVAWWS